MAFLVDIPLCTTEGIPDFNRGYVEKYRHFDLDHAGLEAAKQLPSAPAGGQGRGLVLVTRDDLDDEKRGSARSAAVQVRRVLRGRVEQLPEAHGLGRVHARALAD